MSDEISTDDLFGEDAPAKPAPKPRAARAAKPKAPAEPIDAAVSANHVHWECKCGNTNTHALMRCGKCHAPRYVTA